MISTNELDFIALNKSGIIGENLIKYNFINEIDKKIDDWIVRWAPISDDGNLGNLLIKPISKRTNEIYINGQLKFYMKVGGVTKKQAKLLLNLHIQYKHEAIYSLRKISMNETLKRIWQCYPLEGGSNKNWCTNVYKLGYTRTVSKTTPRKLAIATCINKLTNITYLELLNPTSLHFVGGDIDVIKEAMLNYNTSSRHWYDLYLSTLPKEFSWLNGTQLTKLKSIWSTL